MPTYARREGGAYARGEKWAVRAALVAHLRRSGLVAQLVQRQSAHFVFGAAEFVAHRDIETGRAVDDLGAERADQRRLLLGGLELDKAHYAACAAVMHQLEAVHRTVGRAQAQNALGQRVQ